MKKQDISENQAKNIFLGIGSNLGNRIINIEKTKSLLEEKGQKVIKMCQNSSDLAQFIAKNHENDSFSFFCGKQRRPEIETILHQKKIVLGLGY